MLVLTIKSCLKTGYVSKNIYLNILFLSFLVYMIKLCVLNFSFLETSWEYLVTSVSWTDLGLRRPRLEGEEYLSIVDEFMEAVHARWPKAIVQVFFFQNMSFHVILVSIQSVAWLLADCISLRTFKWSGLLKLWSDIEQDFVCLMMMYRWLFGVTSCHSMCIEKSM